MIQINIYIDIYTLFARIIRVDRWWAPHTLKNHGQCSITGASPESAPLVTFANMNSPPFFQPIAAVPDFDMPYASFIYAVNLKSKLSHIKTQDTHFYRYI